MADLDFTGLKKTTPEALNFSGLKPGKPPQIITDFKPVTEGSGLTVPESEVPMIFQGESVYIEPEREFRQYETPPMYFQTPPGQPTLMGTPKESLLLSRYYKPFFEYPVKKGEKGWFDSPIFGKKDSPEPVPFDIDSFIASERLIQDFKLETPPESGVSKALWPLTRRLMATGYTAPAALNRTFAGLFAHLDLIAQFIGEKTATEPGRLFDDMAKMFESNIPYWQSRADKLGVGFFEELIGEVVGSAVPGVGQFFLDLYSGFTFPYMAGVQRAKIEGRNEILGGLVEAAKVAVLGTIFRLIRPLSKYFQTPIMGGAFAGQAVIEGGTPREAFKGLGTGILFSLATTGGKMGINELRANLKREVVRMEAERPKIEPTFEEAKPKVEAPKEPEITPTVTPSPVEKVAPKPPGEGKEVINLADWEDWLEWGKERPGMRTWQSKHPGEIRPPLFTATQDIKTGKVYSSEANDIPHVAIADYLNTKKGIPFEQMEPGYLTRDNRFVFKPEEVRAEMEKKPGEPEAMAFAPEAGFRREPEKKQWVPKEIEPIIPKILLGNYSEQDILILSGMGKNVPGSRIEKILRYLGVRATDARKIHTSSQGDSTSYSGTTLFDVKKAIEKARERGLINSEEVNIPFAPESGFRREPETAAPEGEITRRSDLVRFLTEKLDIPIRTGRFRDKALGIFKPQEGVIRTKLAKDIEVIMHETGHAIHQFLYPESMTKKGLSAKPFSIFKDELDPMATKPKAGQDVTSEGFAEFTRLYVTDPKKAKDSAPRFFDWFEHTLNEKSPESKDILLQVRDRYQKYLDQGWFKRILGNISMNPRPGKGYGLDELYRDFWERIYPLRKATQEMIKGTEYEPYRTWYGSKVEPLPEAQDPYKLLRLYPRWPSKVEQFIYRSPFEFDTYKSIGKPLDKIWEPIRGKEEEYIVYSVARRAAEKHAQGIETGLLDADVKEAIKNGKAEFEETFRKNVEYRDNVLKYFRDSGIIGKELYEKFKELNKDYVPFFRVFEEQKETGLGKTLEAFQPIKRMKGGWEDIINPMESDLKNTILLINMAERNAIGQALVNLSKIKTGLGKFVEKLPTPMKKTIVGEEEIGRFLQTFGSWTEKTSYKEIKSTISEKLTDIPLKGEAEKIGKDVSEKKAALAKEAILSRGWSEAEADQILRAVKGAPTKEVKERIIERTIESKIVQETIREFGLEEGAVLEIFRPNAFNPEKNVISVWFDGKREFYKVPQEIADIWSGFDIEGMNAVVKLLSYPAKWLRAGATLTPEFGARNTVRDMIMDFIQTPLSIPGMDFAKGIAHWAKRDEVFQDWYKGGGSHSAMVSMDRDYLKDNIGKILQDSPIAGHLKHPLELAQIISEASEAGTRLGIFERTAGKGERTKEDIIRGAYASAEGTVDFRRFGAITKSWSAITAFWNPNMQGLDRMVREFRDNPLPAAAKAIASITIPSLLLEWANYDDPRYKEIPAWQKDLFFVFILNRMSQEEWDAKTNQEKVREIQWITGSLWRLPKPFELGVLFGALPQRFLRYMLSKDPHSFDDIGRSLTQVSTPGIIPTAAIPFIENFANRSTFTGRNIVPADRTDLMPEYQYGPYTSETGKALGSVLGKLPWIGEDIAYSPAKIDNLVYAWTGGLGRYAMQIADLGLKMAGVPEEVGGEKAAWTLDDIPVIKGFHVRFPSSGSESIQRFYDNFDKSNRQWKTTQALIEKEWRIEKGFEILQNSTMVRLDGFKKALSNMHNMIDLANKNPQLTGQEKREFIDITYMEMIEIAKLGNTLVDEMEAYSKKSKEAETRIPKRTIIETPERKKSIPKTQPPPFM